MASERAPRAGVVLPTLVRRGWVVLVPPATGAGGAWQMILSGDDAPFRTRAEARRVKRGILFARVAKATVTITVVEMD